LESFVRNEGFQWLANEFTTAKFAEASADCTISTDQIAAAGVAMAVTEAF
jgi:hypothetical protein